MEGFKCRLCGEAVGCRLTQNLLLISQQDMLLTKPCSGPGYTSVLRGGLSAVKGIWLFYPKHELGQWSINYTRGEKRW